MKVSCLDSSQAAMSGRCVRLWLSLTAVMVLQIGLASAEVYYDSATCPATNNRFRMQAGVEIGDELLLYTSSPVIPTNFVIEYYGTDFSGNEQLRLRFYREGTNVTQLGDLFYDSGWISAAPAPEGTPLRSTDFTTGAVVPLTNALPVDFTWSVQFQGLEAGEGAGLLTTVALPPSIL